MRFYKNHKPKPLWAASCTERYKDKFGMRYYQYNDELDMPVLRKGEIEMYLMELRAGSDIEEICHGIQKAINSSDKKGNMKPDLQTASYLAQEIIDRKQLLITPDILFKICATMLLREDENPAIVDEDILKEKVLTFKSEIHAGGLYDFFQFAGILRLIGLSSISITEFNRLMRESQERQNRFRLLNRPISEPVLQAG